MTKSRFALAWAFIFAVAGYDVYFAWSYREVFHTWELNPVARWLAELCGLWAVFGCKMALMVFAAGVGAWCWRRRHRLAAPYTALIGIIHFALSLQYLFGQLD